MFIGLATLIIACSEEQVMPDPFVESNMQQYVTMFAHEASMRGVVVNVNNIRVVFGNLNGTSGKAWPDVRLIIIDSTSTTWRKQPEELLFHELGHLLLNREHDDQWIEWTFKQHHNKSPKSLMNSSLMPNFHSKGNEHRREYYIDELFNPSTLNPNWQY